MGSWGPGLYQDDEASDLKNTIALLRKLPVSGDRILDILIANRQESIELDQSGAPTFWLVVADQFERKGIRSARALERALSAIDTGADVEDLRAREASTADLSKRRTILAELKARLVAPRPEKPRPKGKRAPDAVVSVGEAYCLPAMRVFENRYTTMNAWSRGRNDPFAMAGSSAEPFRQDGWVAMLILGQGRVYDWLPWCAYASVLIDPDAEPSIDDISKSRLLITDTAKLAVPRRSHLRVLEARLIGRLPLDNARVGERIAFRPQGADAEFAVQAGWSFGVGGARTYEGGLPVSDLLLRPSN